jgi:hypothetical protein
MAERRALRLAGTLAVAVSALLWAGPSPAAAKRIWYPASSPQQLAFPDGSRRTVRSLLDTPHPMAFGDWVWDETGVPPGPIWVRVDIGAQLISVFRGEHEIGTAVILYGGNGKPTPVGAFHVLQKARDYHSITYDAPMPFMLRLTRDGVAIHASNVRPGWATHGCIGAPADFAQRLFAAAALGDTVLITNSARS